MLRFRVGGGDFTAVRWDPTMGLSHGVRYSGDDGYHLPDAPGRPVVNPGDWLVTDPDGETLVYPVGKFFHTFWDSLGVEAAVRPRRGGPAEPTHTTTVYRGQYAIQGGPVAHTVAIGNRTIRYEAGSVEELVRLRDALERWHHREPTDAAPDAVVWGC
jgi:hypothetical protein